MCKLMYFNSRCYNRSWNALVQCSKAFGSSRLPFRKLVHWLDMNVKRYTIFFSLDTSYRDAEKNYKLPYECIKIQ